MFSFSASTILVVTSSAGPLAVYQSLAKLLGSSTQAKSKVKPAGTQVGRFRFNYRRFKLS
jgi:hypothetical protein